MAEDVFGIVGTVIAGAYHVETVVAEGGFGVVYRAHHGGFRAPVALKLLKVPQQNPQQQAEFLDLFRAEAELLFRLSASLPTVVRPLHVDAFHAADGRFVPYLVLEWLEGHTLDALIQQRNRQGLPAVPLRKLVRLLTPIARALERAHNFTGPEGAISIVHRDLKPENIFVAQVAGEEVVKILDFGIGKVKSVASQVAGRMSQDGNAPMAFTPAYAAPEQWAPRHYGQTGPWTDVWGLALCLVEVLAARPIIEGEPATMMGIALDPQRRPTPRNEGVEVPDAVEAVFARALALDPRARQRDAGIFWNELVAALQLPDNERTGALPRDARADDGGGQRVERVELRHRSSGSMPRVQPSPVVEHAQALDLEFDPVSASQASQRRLALAEEARVTARAPVPASVPADTTASAPRADVSGAHYVPDLDLGPAPVPRRASGAHVIQPPQISQPTVLDLDDTAHSSGLNLDLDLPAEELPAQRTSSSQRIQAVRPSSPPSGAQRTRNSNPPPPPTASRSEPPRARTSTPPPDKSNSAPPPRMPSLGSIPPPSSEAGAAFDSGFVAKVEIELPEERPLMMRLRPAFATLGAAIVIAILDPIYAAATGEVLEVVGLRLSLLGLGLLLVALFLGGRELVRESSR
ncbi:MAG: protein kinase [Myxococcales bacterium]